MKPEKLQARLLELGIPVIGVAIGSHSDRSTWRIDFADNATAPQKAIAEAEKLVFVEPAADPEDLDKSLSKMQKAFLVAAELAAGATAQQALTRARLRFKQAMQLLT